MESTLTLNDGIFGAGYSSQRYNNQRAIMSNWKRDASPVHVMQNDEIDTHPVSQEGRPERTTE
jgi:hypothetical protein